MAATTMPARSFGTASVNERVAVKGERMIERRADEIVLDGFDGQAVPSGQNGKLRQLRVADPDVPSGERGVTHQRLRAGGNARGHQRQGVLALAGADFVDVDLPAIGDDDHAPARHKRRRREQGR